ncbi:hypothetical protein LYNGBM3L_26610 [Moorena producens 3L]|uniref:Uncharacterized protein n=1 Tax=Moorena producens 3L TaxID=489825 RepID=F4XSV5_9CYAN|nr:hypothetical protein LYNGBM3L_26610 [Moorena producens 3L]
MGLVGSRSDGVSKRPIYPATLQLQDLRKCPINPPILGDFDIITPQANNPSLGGAGGQNQLNFVSPKLSAMPQKP